MAKRHHEQLAIIHYPDPRLRRAADPVREFDGELASVAERMLQLMKAAKGVGLAAPQIGLGLRLFVMNATGEADGDEVFVNPEIVDPQGQREAEEGCLSIPDVHVEVRRAQRCRIVAHDLQGRRIEKSGADLVARIWQHETDHLNGILIIDRMGPGDRIATRSTLRELEARFARENAGR
jgi:peptide deformylase